MAETNVEMATRDAFRRTVVNEIFLALPLVAMLMEHRRVNFSGKAITGVVYKTALNGLAQSYGGSTVPLSGGSATIFAKPSWGWKYFQVPVEYGVEEEVQNTGGAETAPVDVVQGLVTAAHDGARRHLCSMAYSTTSGAASEGGAAFQSIVAALDHDATYGTLSRATTVTSRFWQSASRSNGFADQDTARSPSIANFRSGKAAAKRYVRPNSKLYCFVGESLFQEYQAQADLHNIYTTQGSKLMKYGFETLMIDGVEVVCDSWLTDNGRTSDQFLLNPETWELRISPKRNFRLTGFKWLGEQNNGPDKYLARVLAAGNLVCWQPNGNLWDSAVA